MKAKRFYGKEIKFLIIAALCAIFLILISVNYLVNNGTSTFENSLTKRDFKTLYGFINKPDFSKETFLAYMDYNFGQDISIHDKKKVGNIIKYTLKMDNSEKVLTLEHKNRKYYWDFNDYVENWSIKLPKASRIFIENTEYRNVNGVCKIKRIPFGVYDVRVVRDGCDPFEERIMAGQNIEIKLNLSKKIIDNCRKVVQEYLRFKEDSINTRKLSKVACVDINSGVYKEVMDEVGWLNNADYKCTKNLISLDFTSGEIDGESIYRICVVEKWKEKINNYIGISENTQTYKNVYYIQSGEKFIINQIKTNN